MEQEAYKSTTFGVEGNFYWFSVIGPPPSRNSTGHFHRVVNISSESSAQASSNDTLLGALG